ncbi:GNAT family N-acetyltransferase [Shewanella sp. 202IG2-18]|uniref:GNAT family N-acetyltransferase n=1 Tax=Parashewanella hymeniacidonis TaxID=2807618 RepID=UPI00195F61D6|nr:GNAT family N-acetyltransferase [Parashewanella hymeniacidonis]MBM7073797.1 GNAT family N-acetyltransferase [Parashewanella hymeniacidonis]
MDQQVALRRPSSEDIEVFYQNQSDTTACQMARFPARSESDFKTHWQRITQDSDNVISTIVVNGEVVGNIMSWLDGEKRLIGYWLGSQYWGKGYATKALKQFLQHFERPLHAYVHQDNLISQRVLEKVGFMPCAQMETEDGIDLMFCLA